MIKKWKELLKPYADTLADIHHNIEAMDEDELRALCEACDKPTSTNCWWAEKRAAEHLKPIIAAEYGRRTMLKMKALDEATKHLT